MKTLNFKKKKDFLFYFNNLISKKVKLTVGITMIKIKIEIKIN